jgi:hypothetical protein
MALPELVEVLAAAAEDFRGPDELVRAKAGRVHDHVELVQPPVACADACGLDLLDAVADQLGVRLLDRGIELG